MLEYTIEVFAGRLRGQRTAKGLSQTKLAANVGIARSVIVAYENRRREPSVKNLLRLALGLNCSADYLIGLSPAKA